VEDRDTRPPGPVSQCRIPDGILRELRSELYTKTGRQWARVTSGSMWPLIRPGDSVLIQPVHAEQVRFGDVVAFERAEQTVVHRVLGTRRDRGSVVFIEKGDLNTFVGEVGGEQVLGRVTCIRRGGHDLDIVAGTGRAVQVVLALVGALVACTAPATSWIAARIGVFRRRHNDVGAAR